MDDKLLDALAERGSGTDCWMLPSACKTQAERRKEIARNVLRTALAGYGILPPPDTPEEAEAVERAFEAWWEHFDGPFIGGQRPGSTYEIALRRGLRTALRAASHTKPGEYENG